MGDTAGTKLCEPIETRGLTAEYVNKTCIFTCILQYLNRKKVLRAKTLMQNDEFHREAFARGDESQWTLRTCFQCVFLVSAAVFLLKIVHIDQTHILLNYLYKTHFLICNTPLDLPKHLQFFFFKCTRALWSGKENFILTMHPFGQSQSKIIAVSGNVYQSKPDSHFNSQIDSYIAAKCITNA